MPSEVLTDSKPKNTRMPGGVPDASKISKLDGYIRRCTLCPLSESRTNAVPGSGLVDKPEIMFVGEAPGRQEDLVGDPFVGAAGSMLNSMLKAAGLERSQVYITNVVKCRPPNNRKPLGNEVDTCTSNYLSKQIKLISPKLVCTLGSTALEYFTGEEKMGPSHGKLLKSKHGSVAVYPTYHPASVFHDGTLRAILEEDIKKIPEVLRHLEADKNLSKAEQ